MGRHIPKGMKFWPEQKKSNSPGWVQKMYESGYAGVWKDDEQEELVEEEVNQAGGNWDAESVCSQYGLAESGAGKLTLSFLPVLDIWSGSMPGPPQRRGDCVSHGQKNAALVTIAAEILAGQPDEETGEIEGAPEVSTAGIRQGVFSTEAIYWWRDHGGDGWSCSHSSRVVMNESGIWVRKNYDEFGFDLTKYSSSLAGKWGRTSPPDKVKQFGLKHRIRTSTQARSYEPLRDLIANYFGINHCGSQGLSNQRDSNGVSRRRGSWAHAMSYIGVDDRPWAKQKYGSGLLLCLNSWGRWNQGPRDVHDSAHLVPAGKRQDWINKGIVNSSTGNIMIPEGSCWVPWSDMTGRYNVASSSAKGWPPPKIKWKDSILG